MDVVVESLIGELFKILLEVVWDLWVLDWVMGLMNVLMCVICLFKEWVIVVIGFVEIFGKWFYDEVGVLLSDLVECIFDVGFGWLICFVYCYGDIILDDEIVLVFILGMFVLLGGEFVVDELVYFGLLEIVVVFDEEKMVVVSVKGDERVYIWIVIEFDDVFSIGG